MTWQTVIVIVAGLILIGLYRYCKMREFEATQSLGATILKDAQPTQETEHSNA